jgi:hypothetical protein
LLFRSKKFKGNTAKMLCRCIRFRLKLKPIKNGLKTLSILEDLENLKWKRFDQFRAPSPPKRLEMSIKDSKLLVALKREVVIELSVEARFKVLRKID